MRKYLNQISGGEVLIYVLLAIAVAMVLTILVSSRVTKLRQDKKRYFIYVLVHGLVFLIFGAILYNLKGTTLNARFITKAIYKEICVAIITAIYLSAFLIMIVVHFRELIYLPYMLGTLFIFIVPTLCYVLFETAISIPVKLHKRWFYPVNAKYPAPHASDMRNIIILNLVFQKKDGDKHITNFKVKAPRAFEFGRLFYYFINDYNEKNPNSKIHYLDNNGEPYGWYFYTKPQWFSSSVYIDTEHAIDTNNIKDGETIICQRI